MECSDPRWGRGQEVGGEDAFQIAEYIYQYANGLQVRILVNSMYINQDKRS
jgi:beta-glucosidase-like glycosyl hydrolase